MLVVLYLIVIACGLAMIAVGVFRWDPWFYDTDSKLVEMIGGEGLVRWYWIIGGVMLMLTAFTDWTLGWGLMRWWR